ncbi:hypothetical protein CYMTET_18816 [Cymbomonas tetramitiformis]|uniref:Uncharacterized protein n=1 Tax=Cymbomonas tetramitiformis TaxID=36881 RepID=A0AAE0G7Z3_9CHLO|nr:hypothetical protein CYMTET_18816 [Cymbomonas tetramitiformis]
MPLTAAKKKEATDRRSSLWDVEVVKRTAKSSLGGKDATFCGTEPRRLELRDSLFESLSYSFVQASEDTATLFDLVDTTGEVNEVYIDILHDPEPLILDYYTALAKLPAALGTALPEQKAKRQLLAALDREFYKEVRTPLVKDIEIDKVDLEDIFTHILQVYADSDAARDVRVRQKAAAVRDAVKIQHEIPPRETIMYTGLGWWRDDRNRQQLGGKFHGMNKKFRFGFAAEPLPRGGTWGQAAEFQEAYDGEDDQGFAHLCVEHDMPAERHDAEPFTFVHHGDVGLRAHYTGLAASADARLLTQRVSAAKQALRQLKEATAGHFFGTVSTPPEPQPLSTHHATASPTGAPMVPEPPPPPPTSGFSRDLGNMYKSSFLFFSSFDLAFRDEMRFGLKGLVKQGKVYYHSTKRRTRSSR